VDRRATPFFPPALSLTALTFATVWTAMSFAVVSGLYPQHAINRNRGAS
jgi:hypothetical protein